MRLFSTLEHDDQINSDVSVNLGILRINQQTERLGLDCRVPAHISLKEVQATLEAQAQPFNLKVKLVDHLPGKKINENDPGLNTSLAIYRHYTDDFRPPLTIGGGTYARAFPKLFAFGAAYHLQDMHTANEKVSLDDLYTMFFVYQATVKAFCQA